MKSRLYYKQAEDAPEINVPTLAYLNFESVESVLSVLEWLLSHGHVRIVGASDHGYRFECIGDKKNLYQFFPRDTLGNTYFRPAIENKIIEQDTGVLAPIVLKKKDSKEGVPAICIGDHTEELEYDELTVETLLSATFVSKKVKNKDETAQNSESTRLVNMTLPIYNKVSDKYNYTIEHNKIKGRRYDEPVPEPIRVLYPCGATTANVTDRMWKYNQLPNTATQSLISLFYQEKFARMKELNQELLQLQQANDPNNGEAILKTKQTLRQLEAVHAELVDALKLLIEKLQKKQARFRELHQDIPAALEMEFPYGYLSFDDVKKKLYLKEKCTKRVTHPLYALAAILSIPSLAGPVYMGTDILRHRPHAKQKLEYAFILYEYRRIAAHHGHNVIPHIPPDEQARRQEALQLQAIQDKIDKKCNSGKYTNKLSPVPYELIYGEATWDLNAHVYFNDIDNGFTARIQELQTYLLRVLTVATARNDHQLPRVSNNSSSLNYQPAISQSTSSDAQLGNDRQYSPPTKR